jgi:hypothetical protein
VSRRSVSRAANASNESRFTAGRRRREQDGLHPVEQERVRELAREAMAQQGAVIDQYRLMARFEPGRLARLAAGGDPQAQSACAVAGIEWRRGLVP